MAEEDNLREKGAALELDSACSEEDEVTLVPMVQSDSEDVDDGDFESEVFSTSEVVQYMMDCIEEVNSVLQLPVTITRMLLQYFQWDEEKLMEKFYDSGDSDELFKAAGIAKPPIVEADFFLSDTTIGVCDICLLTEQMFGWQCGHRFCLGCWDQYLTTKIMEDGKGQSIPCPASACDVLLDDLTVMKLVKDSRVRLRHQHLITNSFVQCNRQLKWCPAPDCNFCIKVSLPDARPVRCQCGHNFCFGCGQSCHEPVSCSLLKKWNRRLQEDCKTATYLMAKTKECPACSVTIEKSGGCNHMVCKNVACNAEFCWVCLGPWSAHAVTSWYHCTRFKEDEVVTEKSASRLVLERYLFFCHRFMNHRQSRKLESRLYAVMRKKKDDLQRENKDVSWVEVQYLTKAVDILLACRTVLMHAYIFAFYVRDKNGQVAIFEENQRDLEAATECLSEYLERDITQENLADLKQKVQDKSRYCETRRTVLLQHVREGVEKDWWEFAE
ncbi:unnamed protein product [Cyprideis torosa]|uniref:RBR-type E3 ubiquitin transferase n=1 Tax=Cyprideis torosa TaxID=163714 RepID=A0A7R8W7Q3_9CRUS|nr:unnamed protein product [Cyprideis torosa]CAG0886605.1 unnamed protein product [Cyprideis torosa]